MKRRIGRRWFLALGAAFAAARGTAFAQTTGKVHRIGVLGVTSPKVHGRFVDAFREALSERGYVEGKDLTIEYRWAEGSYGRLPELAAELIRLPVDLILTHGTPGGRAAKAATATVPIVIAVTGDAVATGLVQSLAHPGGNLTGVTFFFAEVSAKRVELVKEAFPSIKRVARFDEWPQPREHADVRGDGQDGAVPRPRGVPGARAESGGARRGVRADRPLPRGGRLDLRGPALHRAGATTGGTGGAQPAAKHRVSGVRGGRWAPGFRRRFRRRLAACRRLRRSNLQGGETGRSY